MGVVGVGGVVAVGIEDVDSVEVLGETLLHPTMTSIQIAISIEGRVCAANMRLPLFHWG